MTDDELEREDGKPWSDYWGGCKAAPDQKMTEVISRQRQSRKTKLDRKELGALGFQRLVQFLWTTRPCRCTHYYDSRALGEAIDSGWLR